MHFVAVGAVLLNFEASGRVEEADLSVGAASQELRRWSGVSDRVAGRRVETYVLACSGAVTEGEHLACTCALA